MGKIEALINSEKIESRKFCPYVIAEAGVNHEGKMELALRLIEEAAEAGSHAIKFQSYKASTLASRYSPSYWDTSKEETKSQHELFSKYDKFWKKEFEQLKVHCDKFGIEFLSTPFDLESAKFLSDLMPVFKISSSDITNKPFIEFICSFGKPIILSTGASNLREIKEAVSWIEKSKIPYSLLHCILNYPTENQNANLGMIMGLKQEFPEIVIGYSDHTLPQDMKNIFVATLLGAEIIEKHFTFDKSLPGNDHYHAMDKEDLSKFFEDISELNKLIGAKEVNYIDTEEISRKNARRSLVSTRKIESGEEITEKMLTFKRPAHGISPKDIGNVIGRVSKNVIEEDMPIQWKDLSE